MDGVHQDTHTYHWMEGTKIHTHISVWSTPRYTHIPLDGVDLDMHTHISGWCAPRYTHTTRDGVYLDTHTHTVSLDGVDLDTQISLDGVD